MKCRLILGLLILSAIVLTGCNSKTDNGQDTTVTTAEVTTVEATTEEQKESEAVIDMRGVVEANDEERAKLDGMYNGRAAYHGELHQHAATGGTSDGKTALTQWKKDLQNLKLDFATIVDHKQVRHMYLPEWDNEIFIGGTEPATTVAGRNAKIHYNMIFSDPKQLEAVLAAFPKYGFTGGAEGHFGYPAFTEQQFIELIDCVRENGGFFVLTHPTSKVDCTQFDDPMMYYYADHVGMEVIYINYKHEQSETGYKLWENLLAAGKRVWATAGCDDHKAATTTALTTIYSKEKNSASYVETLRTGDFTAGACGIQMCIGETYMGGETAVNEGDRLIVKAGDYFFGSNDLKLDLIDKNGVIESFAFNGGSPLYISAPVTSDNFYRVVVTEKSSGLRVAVGNPIWTES